MVSINRVPFAPNPRDDTAGFDQIGYRIVRTGRNPVESSLDALPTQNYLRDIIGR